MLDRIPHPFTNANCKNNRDNAASVNDSTTLHHPMHIITPFSCASPPFFATPPMFQDTRSFATFPNAKAETGGRSTVPLLGGYTCTMQAWNL
jgi:hypothetical protein